MLRAALLTGSAGSRFEKGDRLDIQRLAHITEVVLVQFTCDVKVENGCS
jgi:hypothetical protein